MRECVWVEGSTLRNDKWEIKLLGEFFFDTTFNLLWITQTKKIITQRVSKVHKWIWEDFPHSYTSPNNFIFHLPFLGKLSPTHTHPLISICEFLEPYELLFPEFESKRLNVNWKKNHPIILFLTCYSFRNSKPKTKSET